MSESFLLDSSALLALTDQEPGAERVRELVTQASSGNVSLYGCFATLTEVQYSKTYDVGAAGAAQIMSDLRQLPISWLHSDTALCALAAEWKASHRVSFADAFVLASAQRSGAILVHKDPEMVQLGGLIRQEVLPLKNGSPATQ
jgi:ribonuclease VapC